MTATAASADQPGRFVGATKGATHDRRHVLPPVTI